MTDRQTGRDIARDRMNRIARGNTEAYATASWRASWALEHGYIPCPDCEAGVYLGCKRCHDEGMLNADGTPIEEAE